MHVMFTPFPTLSVKVDLFLFSYFLESTNSTILLDAMLQALIICIKSLLSGLRCFHQIMPDLKIDLDKICHHFF